MCKSKWNESAREKLENRKSVSYLIWVYRAHLNNRENVMQENGKYRQQMKEFLAIRRAISLNETFVLFC